MQNKTKSFGKHIKQDVTGRWMMYLKKTEAFAICFWQTGLYKLQNQLQCKLRTGKGKYYGSIACMLYTKLY